MTIDVSLNGEQITIKRETFTLLLQNSVAGTYAGYKRALERGSINFNDLLFLSRRGDIPLPLFFSPPELAKAQVDMKIKKLLQGVSRETFQLGTRKEVHLRDVELIIKDLLRKQELLKRHDDTLVRNQIVGLLKKTGDSPDSDARALLLAIGLSHDTIRTCRKKEEALELIINRLESKQILVSRSVKNYMPQRLDHVHFSGMTIRDTKIPYIFLAGGNHGDSQEPVGRTIFTLILMTVLIARRVFKPVTWNALSIDSDLGYEYDVAGAMLMPSHQMKAFNFLSLADVKRAAETFKVTPSAITVRALRMGLLSQEIAKDYLEELRNEFNKIQPNAGMSPILPENAVRKYAGREMSRRMLDVLDAGNISAADFCRTVCLNVLKPSQIRDLRAVVM